MRGLFFRRNRRVRGCAAARCSRRLVSLLGLLDTIERNYRKRVRKSFRFLERFPAYRSEFKEAALEGDPLGPLRVRIKARYQKMISWLSRARGGQVPRYRQTIEEVHELASANYQPKIYPGILTMFRCTLKEALDGETDSSAGANSRPAGSRSITYHRLTTHILKEPGVRILAEKVRKCLDRDYVVADADLELVEA